MRDEVREFKRERILAEATQLFFERTFQGASIESIAERLNVTKPFIYTYFSSKHEILEAVYDRSVQNLLNGVEEIFSEDRPPEEQLRRLVEFYVRQNVESQQLTAVFLNEERNLRPESLEQFRTQHRQFDSRLTGLIKLGIKSGVFKVNDPKIASLSISGMVRWVHRWYNPKGRKSVDEICAEIANLALNLVGYLPAPAPKPRGKKKPAL
jgi:AcrR family transcriptional regulator